jgi:hypothetical protein
VSVTIFSYDDQCEALAEYFLEDDDKPPSRRAIMELAQAIQKAVEDWCASERAASLLGLEKERTE